MYIYLLALLLVCLYLLHWSLTWKARRYLSHLPTLPQLPLLGSVHLLFGGGAVAFRHLDQVSKVSEKRNQPFVLWLGPHPAIRVQFYFFQVLHDPEEMRTFCNAFVEKPSYYDFGKVWLGDGLVLAPGNIWKQNIKKIGGAFTRGIVNGYQDVFNAQARRLAEMLRREVDGPPFNVMDYISHVTLESICKTGFGVSRLTDDIVTEEYHSAFTRAMQLILQRGLNVFYHPQCVFQLTPTYRELMKCLDILHGVSNSVIKKRKRERQAFKTNKSLNEGNLVAPTFKSFLDIMLDLSEIDSRVTDYQIRSEVDTILVGAQESVASALYFILLVIGNKPGVQTKLYDEVKRVVGNKSEIDKDDLNHLSYCEAVVLETLRLYPSFPIVMRCAEAQIKLNSCTIPKGSTCLLNIWGAGRSQRFWGPDAEQFVPERWLPPREPNVSAFIAFSVGKRACIGKTYAIAVLKTILAHCVKQYVFISDIENMKLKVDVVLRPASDCLLRVKLRKDN